MFRRSSFSRFSLSDYIVDAPSTPLTPWFLLHKLLCKVHRLSSPVSYLVTALVFLIISWLAFQLPQPFGSLAICLLFVQLGVGVAMTIIDLFRR